MAKVQAGSGYDDGTSTGNGYDVAPQPELSLEQQIRERIRLRDEATAARQQQDAFAVAGAGDNMGPTQDQQRMFMGQPVNIGRYQPKYSRSSVQPVVAPQPAIQAPQEQMRPDGLPQGFESMPESMRNYFQSRMPQAPPQIDPRQNVGGNMSPPGGSGFREINQPQPAIGEYIADKNYRPEISGPDPAGGGMMRTADFRDSDGNGTDDRDQSGPIGSSPQLQTTIDPANPIGAIPPEALGTPPQGGGGKGGFNPNQQQMGMIGNFLNQQRFNQMSPQQQQPYYQNGGAPQQNQWGNNYRQGFNQPQQGMWGQQQQPSFGGYGPQQGNQGTGKGGSQNAATAQPATPTGGGDSMNAMANMTGASATNGVTQPTQQGYGGKGGQSQQPNTGKGG